MRGSSYATRARAPTGRRDYARKGTENSWQGWSYQRRSSTYPIRELGTECVLVLIGTARGVHELGRDRKTNGRALSAGRYGCCRCDATPGTLKRRSGIGRRQRRMRWERE